MDDRDREACIAGIFLHLQYISYLVTSERLGPFPTKSGQRQRRTVAQPVAIFQTIAISSNDGWQRPPTYSELFNRYSCIRWCSTSTASARPTSSSSNANP
jgi:hypothetical protein